MAPISQNDRRERAKACVAMMSRSVALRPCRPAAAAYGMQICCFGMLSAEPHFLYSSLFIMSFRWYYVVLRLLRRTLHTIFPKSGMIIKLHSTSDLHFPIASGHACALRLFRRPEECGKSPNIRSIPGSCEKAHSMQPTDSYMEAVGATRAC